jgi:3-methyl-2-oxobutanoate hydroxymethyltransferase
MARITAHRLAEMKRAGEKIAVLTAYDSTFSALCNQAGVEVILVGDSLGNVILGHDSTVPVTMNDMLHHTRAVARGNSDALLIGDLPYMAYATLEQTLSNSAALMQAGSHMVKLEGGAWLVDSVRALTERGIPVCAHLGLTPQSVDALGGYKVQGRTPESAAQILADAKALEAAGARLLVVECVPAVLGKQLSETLSIPVIGIGAGVDTDGQVLVLHDMLGLGSGKRPKFVRDFMTGEAGGIAAALIAYVSAVRGKQFPADEHSFS